MLNVSLNKLYNFIFQLLFWGFWVVVFLLSLSILCTSSSYVIFLHHFNFSQATVSVKISNFIICFCSFDLSHSLLEKDNFIEKLCTVLCY